MLRERVTEDIFVFTSELYAQATAGLILTRAGAIVVDTLPFPSEARAMAAFSVRASQVGVRYVILTHYHADHVYGAYLFRQADLITHAQCRTLLDTRARPALEVAKTEEPELEEVTIRLPDITFDEGELALQMDGRVIRLIHAPGHTQDTVMVYVEDARVLFSSDTVMPVPSIADGDIQALRETLKMVAKLPIDSLVQGHGEVILRGEVQDVVRNSLRYLDIIESRVAAIVRNKEGRAALQRIGVEACGLSRTALSGMAQYVHQANLNALYEQMLAQQAD